MEILKEPHEIAAKFLKAKAPENRKYRLLRYVLRYDCPDESVTALYNLVTGEVLGLTSLEAENLKKLPAHYELWMDELICRHFLVEYDFDEQGWVDFLRSVAGDVLGLKAKGPCYVIMPTSACNARCWYCFEKGAPVVSMSEKTADRTAEFIAETCGGRKARISWYGGEPLVRADIIDRICKRIDALGVEWDSLILTNAFAFDETSIEKVRQNWHLKKAIIALDGSEEVFNKTKAFVLPAYSNENPYRRVLNNIGTLLKNEIAVQIRLNLGPDNFDSLVSVLKEISPKFSKSSNCSLRVGILSGTECRFEEGSDSLLNMKRAELISLARSLGFNSSNALSPLRIDGCIAERDGHVLINPKGELSKCYSMIFGHSVGTIWDNPMSIPGKTDNKLVLPECNSCILYPDCYWTSFCDGGCSEENRNKRILQMQYDMKDLIDVHKNGR